MIHEPPFRIESRRVASEPAWEIDVLGTYLNGLVGITAMLAILKNADRFAAQVRGLLPL